MNIRSFLLFASMAVVFAGGCTRELDFTDDAIVIAKTGKTVLSVGLPDPFKTQLGDGGKVYWSNGDQLCCNGAASEALSDLPAGSQSATFTWDAALDAPYKLLYPASIYTDPSHVTLPSVQTYRAGGFADNMFPMAGYGASSSSLTLNHLCAIVKISVLRETEQQAQARGGEVDTDNIARIRFGGRNNEKVSGNFEIDYTTASLAASDGTGTDLEVRVSKNLVTSTETAIEYYLVVPAREYSAGFDVIVQDANYHIMTKSRTAATTLEAGHLYILPAFSYVPTGTELGVEISNADEFVEFAQAYNDESFKPLGSQLIVTVTDDITFDETSSTAFNATGGIGSVSSDNYFNGIFDGGDHVISSLTATVPLFANIGGGGTVKNLTVDGSCSFSFTHPNTSDANFGTVAAYHKGVIDNVKVAADVSLAAVENVSRLTAVGGLAGRASTGKVLNNSEYSGLISTPAGFTGTGKLMIGGLVGRYTNAGRLSNSYFKGAISNDAQISSSDVENPYLVIGGLVGRLDGGATVSGSSTTADHADVPSAYSGLNGTIVNKTAVAYHSAVGGIAGEIANGSVSDCSNGAVIICTVFKVGDDGSSYMKYGGIAGKVGAQGSLSGCTNNGGVRHRSNPRNQDLGGIAGYNEGTVSDCTNGAVVHHMKSGQTIQAGRVVNLGGVLGVNASGSAVSDVHNSGDIEISQMEDCTESEVRLGGVIAYNRAAINGGSTKNITNIGKVYLSPNFPSQFVGYELGGIVGLSEASVQNVRNTGYVHARWNSNTNAARYLYLGGVVGKMAGDGTLSGCENVGGGNNGGEVFLDVKAGDAAHSDNYIGGILGYTTHNVTLSSCQNSGYIHGGNTTKINAKPCFAGGIVAYLSGASSILNCSNTGRIYNQQSNNNDGTAGTSTYTGGIAGWVEGTSAAPIPVGGTSGCTVAASVEGLRGWVGGVVGTAKYAEISSCNAEQDIHSESRQAGGIVGYAENCTISGCSFKGLSIHGNNIQGTKIGGIVSEFQNTLIDGCSSYVSALTYIVNSETVGVAGGAIAGNSVSGNTIQNCHYQPVINGVAAQIVGGGTFTDGGGNAADLDSYEPVLWSVATAGAKKAVSIALIPEGFTADQMTDYVSLARQALTTLFSVEPYKSYKEYFNVWILKVPSNESGANITDGNGTIVTARDCYFKSKWGEDSYSDMSCDSDKVRTFIENNCPDITDGSHTANDVPVAMIINDTRYGGKCHSWSKGRCVAMCPYTYSGGKINWSYKSTEAASATASEGDTRAVTNAEKNAMGHHSGTWMNTLVHEFGGHGFGRLGDEYWNNSTAASGEITNHSWSVPFKLNLSASYSSTPWDDLLARRDELIAMNPLYERLERYQGGDTYMFNRWRSERISCMIDNRPYFSLWQRMLIVQRIMKLAGSSFNESAFFAKDVAIDPLRDGEGTKCGLGAEGPVMPMCPPPTLYEEE